MFKQIVIEGQFWRCVLKLANVKSIITTSNYTVFFTCLSPQGTFWDKKGEFLKQNVAHKKSNAKLKKTCRVAQKTWLSHAKRKRGTLHVQLIIPFCRPQDNRLKLRHFRYFRYYKHANSVVYLSKQLNSLQRRFVPFGGHFGQLCVPEREWNHRKYWLGRNSHIEHEGCSQVTFSPPLPWSFLNLY